MRRRSFKCILALSLGALLSACSAIEAASTPAALNEPTIGRQVSPAAVFTLHIDNETSAVLKPQNDSELCIDTAPTNDIPSRTQVAEPIRTTTGTLTCRNTSMLRVRLRNPNTPGTRLAEIVLTYFGVGANPGFTLETRGYNGLCAIETPDGGVRIFEGEEPKRGCETDARQSQTLKLTIDNASGRTLERNLLRQNCMESVPANGAAPTGAETFTVETKTPLLCSPSSTFVLIYRMKTAAPSTPTVTITWSYLDPGPPIIHAGGASGLCGSTSSASTVRIVNC
jgi:hypothetical protein